MHLGNLVPCHVRHLSAPECANCLTREEFHTLMKTVADLSASLDALTTVIAALAPSPAPDLTDAVTRIDALTATVKAFEGPVAPPAPAPAPAS